MVRASPRKRSAKPGSSTSACSSTFTATVRPSTSSVARQTSPMPPPAMRSSRRYRPPSVVPGLSISATSLLALFVDVGLHDRAADPGRLRPAAAPRLLEEHRDGRHRLAILDRKADEPAVLGRRLAVFRGPGLAAD